MDQLDLNFASGTGRLTSPTGAARQRRRPGAPTPVDHDAAAAKFSEANPHVMEELLALARAELDRGATWTNINGLYEVLRRDIRTSGDAYRLNHNYRPYFARALIAAEPRLNGVMRIKARKCDKP